MGRKVNGSYEEFNQMYFTHPKGRVKIELKVQPVI